MMKIAIENEKNFEKKYNICTKHHSKLIHSIDFKWCDLLLLWFYMQLKTACHGHAERNLTQDSVLKMARTKLYMCA